VTRPRARAVRLRSRQASLGLAVIALALALAPGCGYSVGFRAVGDIEDVAVPIFENRTLRRGFEYTLTHEVRRVILETTPLQLGHERSARAILRGAVVAVGESVLITGLNDTVTESSITISIEVSLVDRKSGRLLVGKDENGDGRPDGPVLLTDSQNFVPARGETRDTAAARCLRDLAERTVQLLERDWGGAQGK
jgi:hypothetical protein